MDSFFETRNFYFIFDKLSLITVSSNFHRGKIKFQSLRNEEVVPLDLEIHYPSFPSGINNNWLIKYTVSRNWTKKTS